MPLEKRSTGMTSLQATVDSESQASYLEDEKEIDHRQENGRELHVTGRESMYAINDPPSILRSFCASRPPRTVTFSSSASFSSHHEALYPEDHRSDVQASTRGWRPSARHPADHHESNFADETSPE